MRSVINYFLRKIFKLELVRMKRAYTCHMCKGGFMRLPNVHGVDYGYNAPKKYEPQFSMDEQISFEYDDLKIYGWIIETRMPDYGPTWEHHWNHKIYSSKDQAIDSISQTRLSTGNIYINGKMKTKEFRVIPLYFVNKNYYRNITINKILNK